MTDRQKNILRSFGRVCLAMTGLSLGGCAYPSPPVVYVGMGDPSQPVGSELNPFKATCSPKNIGLEYRDAATGMVGLCSIPRYDNVDPAYAAGYLPPPEAFYYGPVWGGGSRWGGKAGFFAGGHVGVGIQGTNPFTGKDYRAGTGIHGSTGVWHHTL